MPLDRRDFLRLAGVAAAGAAGAATYEVFAKGDAPPKPAGDPKNKRYAMLIDVKKIVADPDAFQKCIDACHRVHNVPVVKGQDGKPDVKREIKWLWMEKYGHVFPGQEHEYIHDALKGKPVPTLCNHCDNPPCVRVCPTQATFKRESDGIVAMDFHRCIGCRFCMAACPYGSRSFNWSDPRQHLDMKNIDKGFPTRSKGVVEKCNFCAERIVRKDNNGAPLQPACVEAAADDALIFGDLHDENSEIRQELKRRHVLRRKPTLGTVPEVYYAVD